MLFRWFGVALWLVVSAPAMAGEVRLAVLDFINASPDPELAVLSAGLRSMLTTDLTRAPGATIVERERLGDILTSWDCSAPRRLTQVPP